MKKLGAVCVAAAITVLVSACVTYGPPADANNPAARGSVAPVSVASTVSATVAQSTATPDQSNVTPPPSEAPTQPPTKAPTVAPIAALPLTGHVVDQANGYSVTLPDGWTRLDLDDPEFDGLDSEFGGGTDGATLFLMATDMPDTADASDAAGFGVIEVASMPSNGQSLDDFSDQMLDGVKLVFGKHITADRVTLPAGDAIDLVFDMHQKGTSLTGHEYFVPSGDNIYLVAILGAGMTGKSSDVEKEADAVSKSFELLN